MDLPQRRDRTAKSRSSMLYKLPDNATEVFQQTTPLRKINKLYANVYTFELITELSCQREVRRFLEDFTHNNGIQLFMGSVSIELSHLMNSIPAVDDLSTVFRLLCYAPVDYVVRPSPKQKDLYAAYSDLSKITGLPRWVKSEFCDWCRELYTAGSQGRLLHAKKLNFNLQEIFENESA